MSLTRTGVFQLLSYPATGKLLHWYLSTIRIRCSTFVKFEYNFFYAWSCVQLQFNQRLFYDSTKLAFYPILHHKVDLISKYGNSFKQMVSFDDMVHFIDEHIMTFVHFHHGMTFFTEASTKVGRINRERKTVCRSMKTPSATRVTIQITFIDQ